MLKYDKDRVFFESNGTIYELTSQPYEPCLYIKKEGQIIKTIHNAWTTDTLSEIFQEGGTIEAFNGERYSEKEFCTILEKFIESRKTEADWTYIAKFFKEE